MDDSKTELKEKKVRTISLEELEEHPERLWSPEILTYLMNAPEAVRKQESDLYKSLGIEG